MKNILICTGNLAGGGAEKVLVNILNKFDYSKYKVTLVVVWNYGFYLDKINDNVEIKYIWENNKNVLSNIRQMKLNPKYFYNKYLKGEYDIEISFLEGITTNLMSHSNNDKSLKIAWVHTNIQKYHWTKKEYLFRSYEKKAYSKFDKLIFVSEDSRDGFLELYGSNDKSVVIYNSIDLEEIRKMSKEGVNIEYEYCLSIGRLIPEKGYERLINQYSNLVNENKNNNFKLIIIGEGWMKEKLEELIKKNNMSDNIKLLPFTNNPYKYIKKCKFFICSSLIEGYSLVTAEALCLNKAILSTDCKGIMNVVDNGKNALIVENSDKGLYNGMNDFFNNEALIREYEMRISEDIKSKFTIQNQLEGLYKIIER